MFFTLAIVVPVAIIGFIIVPIIIRILLIKKQLYGPFCSLFCPIKNGHQTADGRPGKRKHRKKHL